MTAMEQALAGMWRSHEKQKLPYLLVNDVRGYFAEAPAELLVDGQAIRVHVCANEFSLRRHTEHERRNRIHPPVSSSRVSNFSRIICRTCRPAPACRPAR